MFDIVLSGCPLACKTIIAVVHVRFVAVWEWYGTDKTLALGIHVFGKFRISPKTDDEVTHARLVQIFGQPYFIS